MRLEDLEEELGPDRLTLSALQAVA
jgi:hypothetical protein